MADPGVIPTLSLMMVCTSFAAVEARNLRVATGAYLAQALLVCGLLTAYAARNPALWWWVATALGTKAVLVPWFLWRATRGAGREAEPLIGLRASAVVLLCLLGFFFRFVHSHAARFVAASGALGPAAVTNLAVGLTIFAMGLYAVLTRRDAVKTVIGLCLLENGVHLSLVSLAPAMPETALLGIASEVVVTVYLLLVLVRAIRVQFGGTDTFRLSELHG
jgi:hydrogenase-4 component E